MELREEVIAVIAEKAGVLLDEVTPGSELEDDLDLDSLDKIELLMEFEKRYNIQTDDGEIENLKTVADVIAIVEAKVSR